MNIWIYEDVVSRSDYFALLDEFKPEFNHWAFNKREHNSYVLDGMKIKNKMGHIPYPTWGALTKASNRNAVDGLGDNTALIGIGEKLKYKVMKEVGKKCTMVRVNTNIQFPGQEGTYHYDGGSNAYTMIVMVTEGWESQWGGDFICVGEDDKHEVVPYRPNRGVLFQANYKHRGSAPNQFSWLERKTVAFTYKENG